MGRILIGGLFILCCQLVSLFGMQSYKHGSLCSSDQRALLLTAVVKNSFGVGIGDAPQFLRAAFGKFNRERPILSERVNLLFYNGALYIDRFFPIHQAYDNVQIAGKTYDSLQVANILEVDKTKVIALQLIKENIALMRTAVSGNYYSISRAWDEIKNSAIEERDGIIESKIKEYKSARNKQWLVPYYKSLLNFTYAASILGYDLSNKDFTNETLNEIYSLAQGICREYAILIADYISTFNPNDGEAFRRSLVDADGDILLKIQQACVNYGQYAHTEYMLNYHLLKISPDVENVQFVSYYDMCTACESLWAGIACEQMPVHVVSSSEYRGSRRMDRNEGNPNLILVYE